MLPSGIGAQKIRRQKKRKSHMLAASAEIEVGTIFLSAGWGTFISMDRTFYLKRTKLC
uniref:Uncharacterized protein n=1 Tax=Magnetococcus massalia (strain MO-1) TaxID=451514 RepID=A0A1S7LFD4_MAGMO|nr:protein of unknown function [Candidatus Magnetococcus massalia]